MTTSQSNTTQGFIKMNSNTIQNKPELYEVEIKSHKDKKMFKDNMIFLIGQKQKSEERNNQEEKKVS